LRAVGSFYQSLGKDKIAAEHLSALQAAGFYTRFTPCFGKEINVDESLHSMMYHTLTSVGKIRGGAAGSRTMVLLTGDGNRDEDTSNFPHIMNFAIEQGWLVEQWSWRDGCNKEFHKLARRYPHQVGFICLHVFYDASCSRTWHTICT